MIDSMTKMAQLYHDECKRLEIGELEHPNELLLTDSEWEWYFAEVMHPSKFITEKSKQNAENTMFRVRQGLQPLLFRGVEVKKKNG